MTIRGSSFVEPQSWHLINYAGQLSLESLHIGRQKEYVLVLDFLHKSVFDGSHINTIMTHKKLPLLQCFHIFSIIPELYTWPKITMRIIHPRWYRPTLLAHGLMKAAAVSAYSLVHCSTVDLRIGSVCTMYIIYAGSMSLFTQS